MGFSSNKHIGCFFCIFVVISFEYIFTVDKKFYYCLEPELDTIGDNTIIQQSFLLSMNFVDNPWSIEIQKLFYRFITLKFYFQLLLQAVKNAVLVQREKSLQVLKRLFEA
jgi:hypothetical protein